MQDCAELAATGLNTYAAAILAVVVITATSFLLWRSKATKRTTTLLILLIACNMPLFAFSSVRAQSVPDTCTAANQSTSTNPTGDPASENPASNAVEAVNDGPYITGSIDALLIPFTSNDSAGASTFDYTTVDLDPNTPGYQTNVSYSQDGVEGYFEYIPNGNYVWFSPSIVSPGDTLVIAYNIATIASEITNNATITVQVTDLIAHSDAFNTCNAEYDGMHRIVSVTVTANDGTDTHIIDVATVDLNPLIAGQQTSYTSPQGVQYTVDNSGTVTAILPDDWGYGFWKDVGSKFDSIPYTVQTTDDTLSNQATIFLKDMGCL